MGQRSERQGKVRGMQRVDAIWHLWTTKQPYYPWRRQYGNRSAQRA